MRSTITLAVLVLTTRAASAHPGHGLDGGSFDFVHYLVEPMHLGIVAALALLAAATVAIARKASVAQPARMETHVETTRRVR